LKGELPTAGGGEETSQRTRNAPEPPVPHLPKGPPPPPFAPAPLASCAELPSPPEQQSRPAPRQQQRLQRLPRQQLLDQTHLRHSTSPRQRLLPPGQPFAPQIGCPLRQPPRPRPLPPRQQRQQPHAQLSLRLWRQTSAPAAWQAHAQHHPWRQHRLPRLPTEQPRQTPARHAQQNAWRQLRPLLQRRCAPLLQQLA
jgi:hypothetical protein